MPLFKKLSANGTARQPKFVIPRMAYFAGKLPCVLLTMAIVVIPAWAHAFQVGTHVWIAQQVLNDVKDGKVSIPLGEGSVDIAVDPAIVSALKNHPATYRMGNVGPDAFPDVITGQLVVHPGFVDDRGAVDYSEWQTDDWLRFLLDKAETPEDTAFAYGYLAHAAADVFAHTSVNHYSGDVFSLLDGELEVEQRHVAMENLIGSHTPAMLNRKMCVMFKCIIVAT